MLGKKLGSHSLRVAEACTGWKTRFVSYFWPFATPTNQLNDNDWQSVTKIIPIKLNFCINCGVTWAHQYFRYQTHHFGDIHLAFTEVGSIWAIRWSIRGMHSERWKYWTGVVAGMLSRCCCLLAILGTAGSTSSSFPSSRQRLLRTYYRLKTSMAFRSDLISQNQLGCKPYVTVEFLQLYAECYTEWFQHGQTLHHRDHRYYELRNWVMAAKKLFAFVRVSWSHFQDPYSSGKNAHLALPLMSWQWLWKGCEMTWNTSNASCLSTQRVPQRLIRVVRCVSGHTLLIIAANNSFLFGGTWKNDIFH